MKILICISQLTKGGAERVVSNLSNYLVNNNEISIVTLKNDKIEYEISDKIKIINLDDKMQKGKIKKNISRCQKNIIIWYCEIESIFAKKWGIVSDYKAYSSYMDNLDQYISKDAHVLVIGRNNLYDIYMSSGLFPGMSIEYATDQRLDYELARFDFCVYYSNVSIYDALEQISSSYDMVIITDSIKEYSEDIRLQNIINRIATKSRIKLEAVL